jgi:hypothetical protein
MNRTCAIPLPVLLTCAALAAAEEPALQVSELETAPGRTIRVSAPVLGKDLAAAAAHFVARREGEQWSLEPKAGEATIALEHPGAVLIALTSAPQGGTVWSLKAVVRARGAGPASAGVVRRVGQPLELTPLVDPTRSRPGEDLPFRLHWDGGARSGATVTVEGPGGDPRLSLTTDPVGAAWFRVTRPGRWLVRATHQDEKTRHVAELVFVVPGEERR